MIKAAIFDLDGTISDTLSTIAHYGNYALKECGFLPHSIEKYKYFAGDGKKELIRRMLEAQNAYTEENFLRVEKIYDCAYENDVIFETKPFEQIIELLDELKQNGIKIAVLSNKPDNVAVMVVNELFGEIFDVVHGKREEIEKKPDPSGAFITAGELGVDVSECIFVGDTDVDIKTAKNAKMLSVGVLWGFRDEDELRNAGADYIVKNPMEILEIFKNRNWVFERKREKIRDLKRFKKVF